MHMLEKSAVPMAKLSLVKQHYICSTVRHSEMWKRLTKELVEVNFAPFFPEFHVSLNMENMWCMGY